MMLPYIELQIWSASKELAHRNYPLFCPFVLCLVGQEKLETSHCEILLSFWCLRLIFLIIFDYVSVIILFGTL